MNRNYKLITLLLVGMVVASCSSGNSTPSSTKTAPANTAPRPNISVPQGPFNMSIIDRAFYPRYYKNNANLQNNFELNAAPSQQFTFNNSQCTQLLSPPPSNSLFGDIDIGLGGTGTGYYNAVTASNEIADSAFNFLGPAFNIFGAFAGIFAEEAQVRSGATNNYAGNCLLSVESQTASEFNNLQGQINQLDVNLTNLALATNQEISQIYNNFYQQNYTTASQLSGIDQVTLNDAYTTIYGRYDNVNNVQVQNGVIQEFYNVSGLWVNGVPTGQNIESLNITTKSLNNTSVFAIAYARDFQNALQNLSGAQLNVNCSSDCFNQVKKYQGSSLIIAYNSIANAFEQDLASANFNNSQLGAESTLGNYQNINTIIQNYNNTIISVFYRSATALQEAYTTEMLINKYNFYAYAESVPTTNYSTSLGQVAETLYYPDFTQSPESNISSYNTAQYLLTKLYAARFNQLYLNTISYLYSDRPDVQANPFVTTSSFVYVPTESPNVWSKIYFTSPEVESIQSAIDAHLGSALTPITSRVTAESIIFYQTPKITPLSCMTSFAESLLNGYTQSQFIAAQESSLSTCNSSVYATYDNNTVESGIYIESYLVAPYYVNESNQVIPSYYVTANISQCNINESNAYYWHVSTLTNTNGSVVNAPYFMCSNWIPKYQNSITYTSSNSNDYPIPSVMSMLNIDSASGGDFNMPETSQNSWQIAFMSAANTFNAVNTAYQTTYTQTYLGSQWNMFFKGLSYYSTLNNYNPNVYLSIYNYATNVTGGSTSYSLENATDMNNTTNYNWSSGTSTNIDTATVFSGSEYGSTSSYPTNSAGSSLAIVGMSNNESTNFITINANFASTQGSPLIIPLTIAYTSTSGIPYDSTYNYTQSLQSHSDYKYNSMGTSFPDPLNGMVGQLMCGVNSSVQLAIPQMVNGVYASPYQAIKSNRLTLVPLCQNDGYLSTTNDYGNVIKDGYNGNIHTDVYFLRYCMPYYGAVDSSTCVVNKYLASMLPITNSNWFISFTSNNPSESMVNSQYSSKVNIALPEGVYNNSMMAALSTHGGVYDKNGKFWVNWTIYSQDGNKTALLGGSRAASVPKATYY